MLGWIFLGVAVVAFVIGGVVLGTKSLSQVNDFQRVSFEQGGPVQLDGTGKWVVYLEAGNVDSLQRIPFRLAVSGPSGLPLRVAYYGDPGPGEKVHKFTYDYNGHTGIAAFQFTVTTPGQYTLRAQAVEPVPSDARLAVGRDIAGSTIVGALFIVAGVVFAIAAAVLLIVGYVMRSRHKAELRAGQYWGGAPPMTYGQGYGPQPAFGVPQGYPPPPPGYGPTPGYGAPPGYGVPPAPPGYGPPPTPPESGPPAEQPGYRPPPPAGRSGEDEQGRQPPS
jgi:hypothetical protein